MRSREYSRSRRSLNDFEVEGDRGSRSIRRSPGATEDSGSRRGFSVVEAGFPRGVAEHAHSARGSRRCGSRQKTMDLMSSKPGNGSAQGFSTEVMVSPTLVSATFLMVSYEEAYFASSELEDLDGLGVITSRGVDLEATVVGYDTQSWCPCGFFPLIMRARTMTPL